MDRRAGWPFRCNSGASSVGSYNWGNGARAGRGFPLRPPGPACHVVRWGAEPAVEVLARDGYPAPRPGSTVTEEGADAMARKPPVIPPRPGKPDSCISCQGALHRRSEHYCSEACAESYPEPGPPFRSKWKQRKQKELADPSIALRRRTRKRTNALIKSGRLTRKPCVVCGSADVVPHHEDYNDPWSVIWLCEDHHSRYHDGEIALFGGTLRWDPARLTRIAGARGIPAKKYRLLREAHEKRIAGGPGATPDDPD